MQPARQFLPILIGLTLLVAVVASTFWNLGKSASEWGVPTLLPDDPDITLSAVVTEFRMTGQMPTPAELAGINAAAGIDPLEEEPLTFASLVVSGNRDAEAIALLKEARRRNPAAREVRVLLLDRFLRTADMPGAIGEIGALNSLVPEGRKQLSQLLLGLVAAPDTRHAVIAALRQSPMRKPLITELARAGASSYLLLDLARDLTGLAPGSEDARWSQSVTQALVNQKDLTGARRLWRHFFSVPSKSDRLIFDGSFAGTAAPPFGWDFPSGPSGHSELESAGLRVRYDGRDQMILGRQLLLLPAGQYRLDHKITGTEGPLPNLAWRIECAGARRTLLDLSLAQTYTFERGEKPIFAVPTDHCEGQWLTLVGRTLPVPSMRTALVSKVGIVSASAR
jgi:hypothetical protein